jgi:Protein of unknown function (DUF4231)
VHNLLVAGEQANLPLPSEQAPPRSWLFRRRQDTVHSQEDKELVIHVEKAVKKSAENGDATSARLGFTRHRYEKRLRTYRCAARKWRFGALFLGLALALLGAAAAASGALGKGVEKGSVLSITAIVTGSLVTVLTGFARTLNSEERFLRFDLTRAQLRKEGWDYVQRIGAYKRLTDDDAAYLLFAERIEDLLIQTHLATHELDRDDKP